MSDIKKLKSEIQSLRDKNKNLEFKLNIAKIWMIRQIKEDVKRISKKKINKLTNIEKKDFVLENFEEIITEKIRTYFGDFILMNLNSDFLENLINGELAYYNLKQNPSLDGFSVISSYQKAIDVIIEQIITKPFRKFAKKSDVVLRKNDPLEKQLNSVVHKGYIMSFGRLYNLLHNISERRNIFDYGKCFNDFLNKYSYLKKILLDKQFLDIYKQIISTEVFGKKRHSGQISFTETRKIKKLLLGNFKDKKSLIYMITSTQDIDF